MPKCFQDIAHNLHENYYNSYMEFAKVRYSLFFYYHYRSHAPCAGRCLGVPQLHGVQPFEEFHRGQRQGVRFYAHY